MGLSSDSCSEPTFSRSVSLWYQVICASGACTIGSSGHASARALIFQVLRGESAHLGRAKGAVKLHLVLDHEGDLASYAVLTEGKTAEQARLKYKQKLLKAFE